MGQQRERAYKITRQKNGSTFILSNNDFLNCIQFSVGRLVTNDILGFEFVQPYME